ncbi:MAG: FtsX-like permease family protein [Clostridia bacterium]
MFIFITIKKILESRASLFGMMRACGMNKKSLNKLFMYQNLLILAFALALGLFSSVAVMLTIYFALGQEEVLQAFPVLQAILLSVFYIVSIVIATVLPISKFMKKTITECLKDD